MSNKKLGSTADKLYNDLKNEKKQIKEAYKQTPAYKSARNKKIIGVALGASAIAAGVYLRKNPDAIAKVKKVLSKSNDKQIKDIGTRQDRFSPEWDLFLRTKARDLGIRQDLDLNDWISPPPLEKKIKRVTRPMITDYKTVRVSTPRTIGATILQSRKSTTPAKLRANKKKGRSSISRLR